MAESQRKTEIIITITTHFFIFWLLHLQDLYYSHATKKFLIKRHRNAFVGMNAQERLGGPSGPQRNMKETKLWWKQNGAVAGPQADFVNHDG